MSSEQAEAGQSGTQETVDTDVGIAYLDDVAALTTAYAAWLWVAVVVTSVADGALTIYGIHLGLTEINPVAAGAIADVGVVPALVLLKGGALAVAAGGWVVMPADYRGLVPAGLALPWAAATGVNVVVILATLLG